MEISNQTALFLSSSLSGSSLTQKTETTGSSSGEVQTSSTTAGETSVSFADLAPVLAITDRINDSAIALSYVTLRQGSVTQLAEYLTRIESEVLRLDADPSLATEVSANIESIELEMSKFVGENVVSEFGGSIDAFDIDDKVFQILASDDTEVASTFTAAIRVDMGVVMSNLHSPIGCPICEAAANPATPSVDSSVSASLGVIGSDEVVSAEGATTNSTNSTGATYSSASDVGYIEGLRSSVMWDIDIDGGETLTYSFYDGTVPYVGYSDNYDSDGDGSVDSGYPDYAAAFNSTQMAEMRDVYELWDVALPFTIEEVTETSASNVGEARVAYLTEPDMRSGAAAFAYYPNSGTTGGDAWYIVDGAQNVNSSDGSFDYNLTFATGYGRIVALHEIGHSIGLSHPHDGNDGKDYADYGELDNSNQTVMSYTQAPWLAFYDTGSSITYKSIYSSTPMVNDVAAVEHIYGAVSDANLGDTTYTITDHQYIQTIVDSGGTDTIDVSALAYRSVIDLTPGSKNDVGTATKAEQEAYLGGSIWTSSNLFEGVDNLGIAYSATIENIIGSAGDDTFTGNSSNNVIKGGAGDDTIDGGAGTADYAVFSGNYADYTITGSSGSYTVTDNDTSDGDDGTDTISNVEYFEFADMTYNPAAQSLSDTSGGGALSGSGSSSGGGGAPAPTAISIVAKAGAAKKGSTNAPTIGFNSGPSAFSGKMAAAHGLRGLNLATVEGREEALIILKIGLGTLNSQSSGLSKALSSMNASVSATVSRASSSASSQVIASQSQAQSVTQKIIKDAGSMLVAVNNDRDKLVTIVESSLS